MSKATFLTKNSLYEDDYDCILRNPQNEFNAGLHYHDFYECVLYLGNAGVFQIDDHEYLVRRGDIVLIDMFKPHTLLYNKNVNYERFSMSINLSLLISFSTSRSNLLDVFHECNERDPVYHLNDEALKKYLVVLEKFREVRLTQGKDILEKAMLHQILAYIYSDCYTGSHVNEKEAQHAAIMAKLFKYINKHLSEDMSLEDLAREVNYSEYYVSRLFKSISGKTITNYIQEKRIEEAAGMIRGHVPINQAAEQVGFNNYSYFYKTFKKLLGKSPAEYQEEFAGVQQG